MIWAATGAAAAWAVSRINRYSTTKPLALALGAAGGWLGGAVLAPALSSGAIAAGDFSPFALVTATATGAALLVIAGLVFSRRES